MTVTVITTVTIAGIATGVTGIAIAIDKFGLVPHGANGFEGRTKRPALSIGM